MTDGSEAPSRYEAELIHKDGRPLRVMLTLSRIVVQKRAGFMAVATRLSQPRALDIQSASSLDDLEAASRRTRDLAGLMMNHGADAIQVSRMLSAGADGVVRKAIEFILAEVGPAPVPFDVMLMGSLGRREVTLSADQDHAIIYAAVPEADAAAVQEFFLDVGQRLADLLAAAGYPYCEGLIMGSEPACCQTLSGWCRTFAGWIAALEPTDLLRAKIFFDFRSALDEGELVPSLQAHLADTVRRHPRFIPLLAHSILVYEPPLNAFGSRVVKDVGGGRTGIDIKGVIAQVVDVARLRALQHGLTAAGTLERLDGLAAGGHLPDPTTADTAASFRTFLNLRLGQQARRRADQLEVDNVVVPADLDPDRGEELRQALRHLKALKENLQYEFGARQ